MQSTLIGTTDFSTPESREEVRLLCQFIEHAPPAKPVGTGLLGWFTPHGNYVCISCAGRIMDRGCRINPLGGHGDARAAPGCEARLRCAAGGLAILDGGLHGAEPTYARCAAVARVVARHAGVCANRIMADGDRARAAEERTDFGLCGHRRAESVNLAVRRADYERGQDFLFELRGVNRDHDRTDA